MKIKIYPKSSLESIWQKDKKQFAQDTKQPPMCLRCGNPLDKPLIANARSRYINVYICETCGIDESLREIRQKPLPLYKWHAVNSRSVAEPKGKKITILTPLCSFKNIFQNNLKKSGSAMNRPSNEVAYSRSDYDGYKWWTTWNNCQKRKPEPALVEEIDQFQKALFEMPDFKNLAAMSRLSNVSEQTGDSTEFNLYSETEHFYIWLRMITRPKDYNLYVHYYLK